MFTGLVEDIGTVVSVTAEGRGQRVTIRTRIPMSEVALGDSIAVDGACLTVDRFAEDTFVAVVGQETMAKTSLSKMNSGRKVHLERAARLGQHLGGHLVQGHVDGVASIISTESAGESWIVGLEIPHQLCKYIATKGSLCVDGVSLTVNAIEENRIRLNIVPHTMKVTLLGTRRTGDFVNIEVDIIAKYVERILGGSTAPRLSYQTLFDNGFVP